MLPELGLRAGDEIEKLAGNADAFSPEEKIYLWNGLLNNLMEIKEYEAAKRLCRRLPGYIRTMP